MAQEKNELELLRCYIHGMKYIDTKHGPALLDSFFRDDQEKAHAKRLYDRWIEQKEIDNCWKKTVKNNTARSAEHF